MPLRIAVVRLASFFCRIAWTKAPGDKSSMRIFENDVFEVLSAGFIVFLAGYLFGFWTGLVTLVLMSVFLIWIASRESH